MEVGELLGIVTLSPGFDEYLRVHRMNHSHASFAQPGLDEEADSLINEGFAPSRSQRALWWLFCSKPFNPVWQARQAWARLKGNFLAEPKLHRTVAWALQSGADWLAAAGG
jgi:hypothetical protein